MFGSGTTPEGTDRALLKRYVVRKIERGEVSVAEASKYLKVSRSTVWRMRGRAKAGSTLAHGLLGRRSNRALNEATRLGLIEHFKMHRIGYASIRAYYEGERIKVNWGASYATLCRIVQAEGLECPRSGELIWLMLGQTVDGYVAVAYDDATTEALAEARDGDATRSAEIALYQLTRRFGIPETLCIKAHEHVPTLRRCKERLRKLSGRLGYELRSTPRTTRSQRVEEHIESDFRARATSGVSLPCVHDPALFEDNVFVVAADNKVNAAFNG